MLAGLEPRPARDRNFSLGEALVLIGIKKSKAYMEMKAGRLAFKRDNTGHRYFSGYHINCYWRKAMNLKPIPYPSYGKAE